MPEFANNVVPMKSRYDDYMTAEAMMICALVEHGEFLPVKWGVSYEDTETYQKAWRFCEDYQAKENEAPPWALLRQRFPDLPVIRGMGCEFAAAELARDAQSRRMRIALRAATEVLKTGKIDEAQEILSAIDVARPNGKPGASVWAPPNDDVDYATWPTPYTALNRATRGGLRGSELWYLCGLAGHGKTMILCEYVAQLLQEGCTVSYLSLEVPARTINKRVRRSLANKEELALLDATIEVDGFERQDTEKVRAAIEMQRARIPGELTVYDSSHGQVKPNTVRYHATQAPFVVVDHIGLMYTADGKRAVDDWRLYAVISNSLLEAKNSTGATILAAAQLNRTAESKGRNAPGSDTVGGAYQLVQDADVLITMKRRGHKAMVHGARKVREGNEITWYSDFDVKAAKFGQITPERADELAAEFPINDD